MKWEESSSRWRSPFAPGIAMALEMNSFDMISHVVNTTENAIAACPFADYARIMLRFVSGKILLARKPTPRGLSASWVATEERLGVSLVVFSEVTASSEHCSRSASWISATPCPLWIHEAIQVKVSMAR